MTFMLTSLKLVFLLPLLLLILTTIMSLPSFIHHSVFEGIHNDLSIRTAGTSLEKSTKTFFSLIKKKLVAPGEKNGSSAETLHT